MDPMRKFEAGVEHVAAALMIFVTVFIFLSVMARYFFNSPFPDTNDISRLLLGPALMFGIAVTFLKGAHITMDTLWLSLGPEAKRALDIFAGLFSLVAIAVMTWMLFERINDTYQAEESTFDLRLPIWIFFLATGFGSICATMFAWVHLLRVWHRRR